MIRCLCCTTIVCKYFPTWIWNGYATYWHADRNARTGTRCSECGISRDRIFFVSHDIMKWKLTINCRFYMKTWFVVLFVSACMRNRGTFQRAIAVRVLITGLQSKRKWSSGNIWKIRSAWNNFLVMYALHICTCQQCRFRWCVFVLQPEEMPGSSKFSSPTANVVGFERESSKNTQDYYQGVAFFFRSRDPKRKSEPPIVLHGTNLLGKFEEVADPGVVRDRGFIIRWFNATCMIKFYKCISMQESPHLGIMAMVVRRRPNRLLVFIGCLTLMA